MPLNSPESHIPSVSKTILSVVVVIYNMGREAPRTLFTLTPEYQNLDPHLYEVIVMDNGSKPPLGKKIVESMSENFRYVYISNPSESPAHAINRGAEMAKGKYIGIMIDGARMLTPGVLKYALSGFKAYTHPAIITLGFHLGFKPQQKSVQNGYNQKIEDKLLQSVRWQDDGYELFKISCFAGSSRHGWFGRISESNCIFLEISDWIRIGGFEEAFQSPGGGLVNLDFYYRVCLDQFIKPVVVLGEGNFHQFHQGATTGESRKNNKLKKMQREYSDLRDRMYASPDVHYHYIGHLPKQSIQFLQESIMKRDMIVEKYPIKKKIQEFMRALHVYDPLSKVYKRLTS